MVMRQDASTGELVEDPSAAPKPIERPKDTLDVKVWSPFRVYYRGDAKSVTGVNATGQFDVLPQHHNFISLLTPSELVLQTRDGELRIRISGGVMRVHHDVVTVFLEV
jgi:F0F1-type ATP synthase epsilon subunit